ncbi:MAG: response regulator [Elusimicrobia bacterium]|nr:response regulator [Elusimicrobiota bacterium]
MAKKILIIDDEPDFIKVAVARLEMEGYSVVQAADGLSGLDMMQTEKPDMVILDVMLPGINGYEVCHRAKLSEAIRDIPIVIFTASVEALPASKTAQEIGVSGFILKPYKVKELLQEVKRILNE